MFDVGVVANHHLGRLAAARLAPSGRSSPQARMLMRNLRRLTLVVAAALLVLPAVALAAAKPGTYKGTLANGNPVKLVVKQNGRTIRIEYQLTYTCQSDQKANLKLALFNNGSLGSNNSVSGTTNMDVSAGKGFRAKGTVDISLRYTKKGKFAGTLSSEADVSDSNGQPVDHCSAPTKSFLLKRTS